MAVTDYKFAGTAADNGGASFVWTEPDYAKADDSSFAHCYLSAKAKVSNYLVLTNYGFSSSDIPEGATINGIEIKKNGYATDVDLISDSGLYLLSAGSPVGSNLASAIKWTQDQRVDTYGGSANMCGTTLTQTDIVSSTFGIQLSVILASNKKHAYVDYINIRVYYTEGGGATVFLPNIMKHNFIPPLIGGF